MLVKNLEIFTCKLTNTWISYYPESTNVLLLEAPVINPTGKVP